MADRTDPLRQFVFDSLLHTHLLTVAERKALVAEAMVTFSKGRSTVYSAIAKVKAEGSTSRRVRSDKGTFRAFSTQAFAALTDLIAASPRTSGAAAHRYLREQFPSESFCDDTVRAAIGSIRSKLGDERGSSGV